MGNLCWGLCGGTNCSKIPVSRYVPFGCECLFARSLRYFSTVVHHPDCQPMTFQGFGTCREQDVVCHQKIAASYFQIVCLGAQFLPVVATEERSRKVFLCPGLPWHGTHITGSGHWILHLCGLTPTSSAHPIHSQ